MHCQFPLHCYRYVPGVRQSVCVLDTRTSESPRLLAFLATDLEATQLGESMRLALCNKCSRNAGLWCVRFCLLYFVCVFVCVMCFSVCSRGSACRACLSSLARSAGCVVCSTKHPCHCQWKGTYFHWHVFYVARACKRNELSLFLTG